MYRGCLPRFRPPSLHSRRRQRPELKFVKRMRFAGSAMRQANRMTREHALLLLFASTMILFLILCSSQSKPIAIINWSDETSDRNEAEIDAALQDAAAG